MPDVGAALVDSPDVDMISFTGSTAVGQRIYQSGAATMKRLLMELGGKGACLVFDDADLGAAVTALVSVWAFHSGQICTAPTRAIVHRGVYDELVSRLAGVAPNLEVGDPTRPQTIVGPVISAAQRDRIEALRRPRAWPRAPSWWPAASDPRSTRASTPRRRCWPAAATTCRSPGRRSSVPSSW